MPKSTTLCLFTFIITGLNFARAGDIPPDIKSYVNANLKQYEFFRGRLKKFGSNFYSDTQPWFFVQDFNGDNKPDWIGVLAKEIPKDQSLSKSYIYDLDLICICSIQDNYIDITLTNYAGYVAKDNSVSAGLFLRQPGTYSSQVEGESEIRTSLHSVEFTDYEKSSRIFFWRNEKFDVLWTSD